MARQKFSEEEVQARLAEVEGWEMIDGRLHREFQFSNFLEAFGFMTQVAMLAERRNHHPDWSNVYNRVVIDLWTHDAGGLTPLDFDLAQSVSRLLDGGSD
ncbi:MAG: 4a-hydroxytetrahydrobiopterin dehydratase [Gemmatimonadales bacterium]|nr:4a-hydroxytetrahydrobiopterin dehydratase [Gemmatimonadales bacterium]